VNAHLDLLPAIREFAVKAHEGSGPAHDFQHVERVYALSGRIASAEGADPFIVAAAALLHDVGRSVERRSGSECDRHEEHSARLAAPFLRGLGLEERAAGRIVQAILRHRHRRGLSPEALEDKCLFDADKLDSLGAVGVARAYLWLGEYGRSVYYPESQWIGIDPGDNSTGADSMQREWHIKLKGLKDGMMTATGRSLALERHERMERFLGELEREIRGAI
jgi:uncharacterized protein